MTDKTSGKEENLTGDIQALLGDVLGFVEVGSGLRVRRYQREVLWRIIDSVENHKGHTIVVIFPRQSGKNEMQAQVEAYLLARYSYAPLEMVKVSPTWKPQAQNAMRRLEKALNQNPITRTQWRKEQGYIYRVGRARITFLSGSPTSSVVGATANLLLSCDEAQDIELAKWDRDFNPMAAATNATKVFWGTAWTAETLLAREKRAAQKEEAADGERRVYEINADKVRKEVPAYGTYVDKEVAKMGRWHPMVRTQYFSEEMEAAVGMFPPERRAMMRGDHEPLEEPEKGKMYAFLMDVGGESARVEERDVRIRPQEGVGPQKSVGVGGSGPRKALGEQGARIRSQKGIGVQEGIGPQKSVGVDGSKTKAGAGARAATAAGARAATAAGARAATALTVVEVDRETLYDEAVQAPRYLVRKRRIWQGMRHTDLHVEIKRMMEVWDPRYLIIDATGVGAGLASFLEKAYPTKVVPFTFSAASKSKLGWDFLGVVETGRFLDFRFLISDFRLKDESADLGLGETKLEMRNEKLEFRDENAVKSQTLLTEKSPIFQDEDSKLQELFWQQVRGCEAEVRVGPGQVMKWGVPAGKRDPETNEVLQDDLVVSAALCAVLDRQVWGRTESVIIEPDDIFKGAGEVF